MIEQGYISPKLLLYAGLITGLAVIAVCSGSGSLSGVIAVMLLPVALYYLIQTLRFPVVAFYGLFSTTSSTISYATASYPVSA